jgi:LPS export ABC transporter protein LptC
MNLSLNFFLISLALVCACSDYSEKTELPKPDERPNQEGWNSKAIFTTNGVTDAELIFGHMMRWDKRQLTTFNQGIHLDFFEKGTHTALLTADSGEVKSNTNSLLAIGHVVVISDSGVTMRTKNLYWDDKKQRIFADGFVTMTSEEDTLNGYNFESDKNLSNWKMKNAFGQSARDIDLRTGTVKSKKETSVSKLQERELDKEMEKVLKEKN